MRGPAVHGDLQRAEKEEPDIGREHRPDGSPPPRRDQFFPYGIHAGSMRTAATVLPHPLSEIG
jgi:hypothetical protein